MEAESSQRAASSSTTRRTFDVFLSFRGETRLGFTDHLHFALQSKGFIVFRDEEKLEQGEDIRPELLKAIQESEYAIIVISENYAFSTWCLDELSEIVKCKREKELKVLPIFYKVDPSNVRKQKGRFGMAFAKHVTNNVDEKRRKIWRGALEQVCDVSGWDVRGRHESEIVRDICRRISDGLNCHMLEIDDDLVGIESRIEKLMTLLHIRGNDVRFVGICGMGGIGKTTIAKVVYNKVSSQFEAYCFISNVREESKDPRGLLSLQKELISQIIGEESNIYNTSQGQSLIARRAKNKKVFIVLDDVDKEDQLKNLVGKQSWFHEGSRVLVTSRERGLLERYVDQIYEVEELTHDDALLLFNLNAFKECYYEGNCAQYSEEIIKYARGLPLALKVFGSFLFGYNTNAWKRALDRLKVDPGFDILDKLKISFDGLSEIQKNLFLDIACFFNGKLVNQITYKLDALGHFPQIDIPILERKSLINILKDNYLLMHDLLQEMGHQIVHFESPKEPGKRSRLWCHKDIINVLNKNIGTNVVESIFLKLPLPKSMELSFEGLSKMKNLKALVIGSSMFTRHGILKDLNTIKWDGDPSNFTLSNELCIIEWLGYPLEYLPIDFEPANLVELRMPRSRIKQLWATRKNFDKLKYIDLEGSQNLFEMPSFNEFPCLEKLNVRGTAIRQLSSTVPLKSLNTLCVGGSFSRPVTFSLFDFSFARSLKKLKLVYCNLSDEALSSGLCCLPLLEILHLSGNNFMRINDLSQLPKLRYLGMDDCSRLKELPSKFSLSLSYISVQYCPSVNTSPNPRGIWSSSEVLVAGDTSVAGTYFGYNGRRERTLHFGPSQRTYGSESFRSIHLMPLSWGPTLTSDIPEWFNNRSANLPDIFGMSRCQIDFGFPEPLKDLYCWLDQFYIALFIVYEVLELDSCQRKRKRGTEEIEECENSISRIFPVFHLELQVNNAKYQSVFRVPEFPSVGSNGVWVYMGCSTYGELYPKYTVLSCSVTVSRPNVQIRESRGRVDQGYDSECYEIIRRISPHDFASESPEYGFFDHELFVYLRERHSEGEEEWEEDTFSF